MSRQSREQIVAELELRKLRADVDKAEALAAQAKLDLGAAERREEEAATADYAVGVYTFYDSVNDESVAACIAEMATWARRGPKQRFEVIFNSPGGFVHDGLALYDFLRCLSEDGHHITTVGIGEAMSMGAVLLQAGDHRVMTRYARMMIHAPRRSTPTLPTPFLGDVYEELKQTENTLISILAERATVSKKEIKEMWERRDLYLSAREALKLGLIDQIRGGKARRR